MVDTTHERGRLVASSWQNVLFGQRIYWVTYQVVACHCFGLLGGSLLLVPHSTSEPSALCITQDITSAVLRSLKLRLFVRSHELPGRSPSAAAGPADGGKLALQIHSRRNPCEPQIAWSAGLELKFPGYDLHVVLSVTYIKAPCFLLGYPVTVKPQELSTTSTMALPIFQPVSTVGAGVATPMSRGNTSSPTASEPAQSTIRGC